MIRFKTLTLKNFLSYGAVPTVINLDKPGTTLILGEDLDNTTTGTGANGVGKTVIINALVYGIYDRPLSNITKDNLVNNINKANMEVVIEFEKGEDTYVIKRARKTKAGAAGNHVHVFVNGKDVTPDSVGNANDLIETIIGIPYDIFVRVAAISATHTPFLDLPVRSHYAANQTDIIEELFDLKTLSEKANALKEVIKETEQSLEVHMARVEQAKKERERHEQQIAAAERRVLNWTEQNKTEVNNIQKKLKKIEDVDIELQRQLHDQVKDVTSSLNLALDDQRGAESQIKKLNKTIKTVGGELEHLRDDKCPYCLQQYQDAVTKISEAEMVVAKAKTDLELISVQLGGFDESVEKLTIARKELVAQITVNDMDELLEIRSQASHYRQKLDELANAKNPFVEPLQELQDTVLDDICMDKVNELTKLIDHQKFLLKLLTKKDSFVRKTLLNKNIPFLNTRLAHYLSGLGLPHTVEFTHEMTASISQFGRPLDFGNLSNGQRARVNLALSFAFRDVLQSMHDHINICMLDEVLDVGLDTVGVQNAAKMLKRKARDEELSLFIISHRDEVDSAFDRKMTVQMSKGFSNVIMED